MKGLGWAICVVVYSINVAIDSDPSLWNWFRGFMLGASILAFVEMRVHAMRKDTEENKADVR